MPVYNVAMSATVIVMLTSSAIGSAAVAIQPSIASLVQNATFYVPETSYSAPQLAEPGIEICSCVY